MSGAVSRQFGVWQAVRQDRNGNFRRCQWHACRSYVTCFRDTGDCVYLVRYRQNVGTVSSLGNVHLLWSFFDEHVCRCAICICGEIPAIAGPKWYSLTKSLNYGCSNCLWFNIAWHSSIPQRSIQDLWVGIWSRRALQKFSQLQLLLHFHVRI